MKGIKHDPATGKYYLTESGLTYYMDLEHTRLLKDYFRGNVSGATISDWHRDLDRFTRAQVQIRECEG